MLEKFQTYQLAVNLYRQCEGLKVPSHVKDQLNRATLSVVLNLAEGSAKPTEKDRRKFYAISLGSLRETEALIMILGAQKCIDLDLLDHLGSLSLQIISSQKTKSARSLNQILA